MQLHVGVPTAQHLLKTVKLNITSTALGHMNLKCPQSAMKLNNKF
jgi:predicted metalloenzyme YecM